MTQQSTALIPSVTALWRSNSTRKLQWSLQKPVILFKSFMIIDMQTQTSEGNSNSAKPLSRWYIERDKWKWTVWNIRSKQQKNKDEEGVKVLHTKSQAGRTQKSGPPATRFECHLFRCTVKLRTACERGKTRKNRERRKDRTQLQDVRNLRLEWWNALRWSQKNELLEESHICKTGNIRSQFFSCKILMLFSVGIMLASLCFLPTKYIHLVKRQSNLSFLWNWQRHLSYLPILFSFSSTQIPNSFQFLF